jgi:serine/threonine-protein kinase
MLPSLDQTLSGRYRIERELGAGGMATVYLAEDLRHRRQVALKVLHPELAAHLGTDRFLAEITTAATLQHPGILPLFDSGVADGLVFYVMPYVRGESLRARLDRELQLPLDDVVHIATSVAQALDYAHRQGIIHRDVKPENILLQDGHAFVADFGIALALTAAGGTRLTQTGLSVGTPQYMSPEQASAERTLDARTDVYSLGAVCYEMIAGEPPFSAPTAQGVVARVLAEEPRPVSSLRRTVSPALAAAVHRALEKAPADRWRGASDFANALTHADANPDAARTLARARYSPALVIAALVLGLTAGAFLYRGIAGGMAPSTGVAAPVRYWAIPLPDSSPFTPTVDEYAAPQAGIAIAKDGGLVAYVGRRGATTALHLVRLAAGTVTPLDGTEGARLPAFSPDGRWLAFIAKGELRKISVDGGAVVRLAPVEAPIGVFWLSDERLLVSRTAIGPGTIPAAGGPVEPLGDRFYATSFVHTQLLPGGKFLLGTTAYGDIGTISLETGAVQFISAGNSAGDARVDFGSALRGRNPHYISSGHLLYASGSSLMAMAFDLRTMRATGKPTPLAADVRAEGGPGESHFAVSDDGTLVYAPGLDGSNGSLVWVDQHGVVDDTLPLRAGSMLAFRLSRDGQKLALIERLPNGAAETRIADLVRRVEDPAHLAGEFAVMSWLRNGRGLVGYYVPDSAPGRAAHFVGATLDAVALSVHVTPPPPTHRIQVDFDESPDGSLRCEDAVPRITRSAASRQGAGALLLRRLDDRVLPREVADRGASDCAFSPDGRWIAYTNHDGLFVTRATLDSTAQTFKLAPDATSQARWMPNGKAIVYRNGRALVAVDVRIAGDTVDASEPRMLFQRDGLFSTWDDWGNGWDIGRDGRLLVWQKPAQPPASHLKVITNLGQLAAKRLGAP